MFAKLTVLGRVQARTLRRAAGVIFLNDYARRTVVRTTGPLEARVAVIPHGVDPRFRRAPRPQTPLARYSAERPYRLLYVSTVDVYKHQWQVAEATAALRQRGWPVTLELIGAAYPPALARLRASLNALDPGGQIIRYAGAIPHADLADRYHAADGFVFASSCENMPNILLEAMAAGLPIACADRGPLPEVLGDAGVYFNPEEAQSIEGAIAGLIESPARRAELADAGYRRSEAYSWPVCAARTFEFLRVAATGLQPQAAR